MTIYKACIGNFEVHKKDKNKKPKTMRFHSYESNTVNTAYLKSSHIVPEETKANKPKLLKTTNLIQGQNAITMSLTQGRDAVIRQCPRLWMALQALLGMITPRSC